MSAAKILVVEDELIVATTIANKLSRIGYIVTAKVTSGSQAIAKAIETKPDLILMDIFLKGEIDGITAAAQIRQQLNIPVIYLTAYADHNTLERAKLTKPLAYIIKPFNEIELQVAIELALYQNKLERSLQESQEQLETILESINDGVIATDRQGLINFINPTAEKLTGCNQSEAVGKKVTDIFQIFDEVTGTGRENPVAQVLETEQVVDSEDYKILISKQQSQIPICYSASPLKQKSGEICGAVVVFWDISEHRQTKILEDALVKEQEISRFRAQFTSLVSHEFRNPLSAILTAAELLDRYGDVATEVQKKTYLQRIKSSVGRMNQLMEDLLLLGQAETGKLEFDPVPLELEQFCRDLIEELSQTGEGFNQITLTSFGDCTNAVMDTRLLHYILANLLSNAIKYSPANEKIEFNLTCDHQQQVAIFQIQDQGIGISEQDQNQVFQLFYRGNNVKKIQGTGLGLAIVKRCVERHQGEISLSSKLGVGTTFTVQLPLFPRRIVHC
ncbi:MAG: response regulator [Symploca sp. SIO2B6]|nr:response regulator [Symploca sp. SIO2B6]